MIRKAERKDLEEIFKIIKFGKQKQQDESFIQWSETYPTVNDILTDIEKNNMFIEVDESNNRIMGCICIMKEKDDEYEFVDFSDFYVLHRMSVHPDYYKKGVAKSLLKFSEEYALENKVLVLIADTNPKNIMTNTLLQKENFIRYDLRSRIIKYLDSTKISEEKEKSLEYGLSHNFYYKKIGDEYNEL